MRWLLPLCFVIASQTPAAEVDRGKYFPDPPPQPKPGSVAPKETDEESESAAPATQAERGPENVYVFTTPSGYQIQAAPLGSDPVPALGEADEARLGKALDNKESKNFIDGYVARIEKHYVEACHPPADFIDWLGKHADVRQEFWLAISPCYDDPKAAIEVMDTLRKHDAKRCEKFFQLAIAIAVVHDQPDAIVSSRYQAIWGVNSTQFSKARPYVEIFDYYSADANQARFPFKPTMLPWCLLTYVVDNDASAQDADWAWNRYATEKDFGELYALCPYDMGRLNGKGPKIAGKPYTLPNLLDLGGVCGDQAHFASRIDKAFAIPAMKVTGESRWGGPGHAWCGYLIAKGGRPVLEFTGRYQYDYYYTGDIFDPQTRTMILDRAVAMLYDAASLSYAKYVESQAFARAATKLAVEKPKISLALCKEAIDRNFYCAAAWRCLMKHLASGLVPKKDGMNWANQMMTKLVEHPDLTLECLPYFVNCYDKKDVDSRQKLYDRAYQLYAKRPDLQINLRLAQCAELMEAHREQNALQVALDTAAANAKEGTLILPLVKQVVENAKSFAASSRTFRMDMVKAGLAKVEKDFPKQRGSEPSEAYAEFKRLVAGL